METMLRHPVNPVSRWRTAYVLALCSAIAPLACTTTQGSSAAGPQRKIWVREIDLAPRRGEVGAPFRATLTWRDNYIREPELSVAGLPPGLRFDPASRVVSGRPERAGFFTENLGVRQLPPTTKTHRPTLEERWWPASVELEIFEPVERPAAAPADKPEKKKRQLK
jgi:hypothetical protein